MNRVTLIGRLTRDPDIRHAQNDPEMTIARYSLAVDRRIRKDAADGQQTADFISCVAFRQQAEFAEKYLHKGMKIAVNGRIQTGSYTNREGQKVYTTDVIVEDHEFCESKAASTNPTPQQPTPQQPTGFMNPTPPATPGFMDIPDDDELPFT